MQETQEMQIWSLGGEDPLQKEMATHCSILVWKIPWTEETGGLVCEVAESDPTEWLSTQTQYFIYILIYPMFPDEFNFFFLNYI